MRAFLIDAEVRTIIEINFVGDYKRIPAYGLQVHHLRVTQPLNGSLDDGFE